MEQYSYPYAAPFMPPPTNQDTSPQGNASYSIDGHDASYNIPSSAFNQNLPPVDPSSLPFMPPMPLGWNDHSNGAPPPIIPQTPSFPQSSTLSSNIGQHSSNFVKASEWPAAAEGQTANANGGAASEDGEIGDDEQDSLYTPEEEVGGGVPSYDGPSDVRDPRRSGAYDSYRPTVDRRSKLKLQSNLPLIQLCLTYY